MSPIVTIQRRMMELGRVRLGEKGPRGEPRKRGTFRFTTASKALAEALAAAYGGTAAPWEGAPDDGYYEVKSDAAEIDIVLPPVFADTDGHPTTSYSQFFELWSGGGCQRRCDGVTEALKGKPCMCNPDDRTCKVTTRVSFMIPSIPGLGVWRLESHGMNAAVELPGTLEVLMMAASEHRFIPAVLRIEHRTKKVPGEGTRRFVVPVIDLPHVTVNQLAAGEAPMVLNAPAPAPPKPALPAAAPAPPDDPRFSHEDGDGPGWGRRPAISAGESDTVGAGSESGDAGASPAPTVSAGEPEVARSGASPVTEATTDDRQPSPAEPLFVPPTEKLASAAQKKKLNVLVGQLRDGGHITNEQLYASVGVNPAEYVAEDGLHWSPLRDVLTVAQASELVGRLERYAENVKANAA